MKKKRVILPVVSLILAMGLLIWYGFDGGDTARGNRSPGLASGTTGRMRGDALGESALAQGADPSVAAEWTQRFLDRIGRPEEDPDFYDEFFAAGAAVLPSLERFLADSEPLLAEVKDGDTLRGLAPAELGRRSLSITLLEAAALQRRIPEPLKRQTLELLARFVVQPVGSGYSEDGYRIAIFEKGKAFAALVRTDMARARDVYWQIDDSDTREATRNRARKALISSGMPTAQARRALREIAES